jgi:hypothetical protein
MTVQIDVPCVRSRPPQIDASAARASQEVPEGSSGRQT